MRRIHPVAALSLVVAAAPACRRASPKPSLGKPNVLLVTIDTLRADRVGCYGHASASTPVLDALSARGVRFETSIAHVPLTGPSHASILSGLGPLGHGFRENAGFVLPAQIKSGADDFRQAVYRTAAFVSAFPLDRRFGFDRGFETYEDHLPKGNDPRRTPYVERFADATTDAVLRWLAAPDPRPFFLWVHYYDPHAPYEPPGELAARFRTAPYDGEVAFADQQLGRLLRALEERGTLARILVVAMSDHGEGLGEHGEGTHGLFVYDSTLKVALLALIGANYLLPIGRVGFESRALESILYSLLVFSPIFCAGLLFGSSIKHSHDVTVDYGANLLGAMEGGTTEYLSLVTGFRWLLILIAAFYVAALLTRRRRG